ncbi:DUF2634 domain-containing protein [Bacillus atrophaeus]|uniref:DUF2634 domain-containing protein n=1 Tax=Bacillus atrophaeus TaxID=1452 RepID=UPI00227E9C3D|nr:DUF2634 domain-containing protein [Bacillus atrophaeus]MCY9197368.1 DUF2634 domain-containing protein [Bacillus atrophaeus]
MKTLKLKNGDLCFENGELQMVEGDAELAQSVEMILKTSMGEFELDEHVGLDRSSILRKQFDQEEAQYDIIDAISQEERIASVESLSFSINKESRNLSVHVKMAKEDEETIEIGGVDLA